MNYTTWVEISRDALKKNLFSFRNLISPKTKLAGIVKSNAYGHGILEVSQVLVEEGADVLGVNSIQEGILLNKFFPKVPILIMGEIWDKPKYSDELANENFWIVVSRLEDVKFLAKLKPRPKIHFKVDTGMARLGQSGKALEKTLRSIAKSKLPLDGIMTHFASTEDFTEHSYSMMQLSKFIEAIQLAESLGYKNLLRHASSSASTLLFENARLDMVRIGISMYGLWPSLETKLSLKMQGKDFHLTPALTWKTRIVHFQHIPSGSYIGYGSTFKTVYPSKIAVIPVGYYEGFNRRLSNVSYVLVNEERAPIVGRVCMNMSMIDVTHIKNIKIGDEVTLIGTSGKEYLSADTLAQLTNTINYDIVTSIHKDIPRILVN
ncbi:MAG: alanine racemase [Leptospiraceae bacterium]|nr:alanine racemase [Leptospiraceae bacterium]